MPLAFARIAFCTACFMARRKETRFLESAQRCCGRSEKASTSGLRISRIERRTFFLVEVSSCLAQALDALTALCR